MANIKINDTTSFPNTTPAATDHVIGTDVSDVGNSADGETVTFLMSAMGEFFQKNYAGWEYVETVWDFDTDGASTSGADCTTSAFEDGYEYMVTAQNMSHNHSDGRFLYFQIQKESDDSWVPSTTSGTVCELLTGLAQTDYYGAIIRCINPRVSADLHLFTTTTESHSSDPSGTDTAVSGGGSSEAASIGFASATKVKAVIIYISGPPSFVSGTITVHRRAISHS